MSQRLIIYVLLLIYSVFCCPLGLFVGGHDASPASHSLFIMFHVMQINKKKKKNIPAA